MEDRKNTNNSEFDRLARAIKTAVTSINGFIVMAEERVHDKLAVGDCLSKIGYSAKNLLEELSLIQTVEELKAGKVRVNAHPLFVPQIIHRASANLAAVVGSKNITAECLVGGLRDLSVVGDDELLVKMLTLIVKNSLEYTPAGGKLTATFNQLPDENGKIIYEIVIKDNGVGMNKKKLDHVFEYDPADVGNEFTGGAALWIASRYVRDAGGEITVSSVENLSTTVTVRLPLDRCEPLVKPAAGELKGMKLLLVSPDVAENKDVSEILSRLGVSLTTTRSAAEAVTLIDRLASRRDGYDVILVNGDLGLNGGITAATDIRRHSGALTQIILYSFQPEELIDRARAIGVKAVLPRPIFGNELTAAVKTRGSWYDANGENTAVNLNDKYILVVEDNELNMEMAKSLIEEMTGAEAECAYNGREAVNLMRRNGHNYYSMIFMDINMPVMNGFDATRAIRGMGDFYASNIPIVAMTASDTPEDRAAAIDSGMNDVITKPFEPARIIEMMKKYKV